MKHATEPVLRKRLTEVLEAKSARERATRRYEDARADFFAAGTKVANANAAVAELLKSEGGTVTYDGHAFHLDATGRVVIEPLARELKTIQEPLQLNSSP